MRIAQLQSRDELIGLEDGLVKAEFGRLLNHVKREEFAAELDRCLSANR